MKDIIERLREWRVPGETITGDVKLYMDAADEIEKLRSEVELWKERYEAERDAHEETIRYADGR